MKCIDEEYLELVSGGMAPKTGTPQDPEPLQDFLLWVEKTFF